MKYYLSEVKYLMNEYTHGLGAIAPDEYRTFKEKGFMIKENFLPEDLCDDLCNRINTFIPDNISWKDDVGSDFRIFGIDSKDEVFSVVYDTEYLKSLYKKYIDANIMNGFTMANKLIYKSNNKGSGGGWHRDSINRRQLKYIIYLNDVTEENGCFQYLSGTQHNIQKYRINKELGLPLGEYRYTNEQINSLFEANKEELINCIGGKGTLLIVDTSGIHRGNPIRQAERYAITRYLWDTSIPEAMKKLLI